MDPNATLAEMRGIVEQWNTNAPGDEAYHLLSLLTDHVEALDKWLSSGGFLPSVWHAACNRAVFVATANEMVHSCSYGECEGATVTLTVVATRNTHKEAAAALETWVQDASITTARDVVLAVTELDSRGNVVTTTRYYLATTIAPAPTVSTEPR